jgi:hypothetical protein
MKTLISTIFAIGIISTTSTGSFAQYLQYGPNGYGHPVTTQYYGAYGQSLGHSTTWR